MSPLRRTAPHHASTGLDTITFPREPSHVKYLLGRNKKPDTVWKMEAAGDDGASARLTGAAALRVHLGLVICLLICIPAGILELTRALGGNTLSWAYVFEWPLFACFGFYMWWRLLHGDQPSKKSPSDRAPTVEETVQLEAWNRYLEELHASDKGTDPH
jgi:hypothetical protein